MLTLQHLSRSRKWVCARLFAGAAVFVTLFVLAMINHRFIPAMFCAAVTGIALITAFYLMTPTAEQQLMIESNRATASADETQVNIEKVIAYALLSGGGVLSIAFIAVLLHGLVVLAAALAGFIFGCMVSTWCVFNYIRTRTNYPPRNGKDG